MALHIRPGEFVLIYADQLILCYTLLSLILWTSVKRFGCGNTILTGRKILLIGVSSDAVDYKKFPKLSKEKLDDGLQVAFNKLTRQGHKVQWCLLDNPRTAVQEVRLRLTDRKNDIIVIGAGIRHDPDYLLVFEQVINLIKETAPESQVAFNTSPFDIVDAVGRYL